MSGGSAWQHVESLWLFLMERAVFLTFYRQTSYSLNSLVLIGHIIHTVLLQQSVNKRMQLSSAIFFCIKPVVTG